MTCVVCTCLNSLHLQGEPEVERAVLYSVKSVG